MNKKIAIIGMGHIGRALQQGLLASGLKKEHLFISNSSKTNKAVVEQADWIILAVKPAKMEDVLRQIGKVNEKKLLFSVAAGVDVARIIAWSGKNKQKIIRLMPNLPVSCGKGVIGFFANEQVTLAEKKKVRQLLVRLGTIIEVKKEQELDGVTVIAGCGPALVAYCIQMFARAGKTFGLSKREAEDVSLQTFLGTFAYLQMTGQTPKELQGSVATKGGVTQEILQRMEKFGISDKFFQSLEKGYEMIH